MINRSKLFNKALASIMQPSSLKAAICIQSIGQSLRHVSTTTLLRIYIFIIMPKQQTLDIICRLVCHIFADTTPNVFLHFQHSRKTLNGHIKTAEQRTAIQGLVHWTLMGGLLLWYSEEGPGRPGPSLLYQMLQLVHQRPVYQLHIIRCGTIIAFAL